MYVGELREFRDYLREHTDVAELKALNLLGVQFTLCEASKYFFYLRYESGPLYKPSSRDFELVPQDAPEADARRSRSIWDYWADAVDESCDAADDELHPDHRVAME